MEIEKKECPKCHKEKLLTEFHKDSYTKDGLKCWCKKCCKDKKNKWYQLNAEEIKTKARIYYKENNKKCRLSRKKYYENNSEKERTSRKKYYAENTEEERERGRKWREENPEYSSNYIKEKRKNDPVFRLNINFSSAISRLLKDGKNQIHWEKVVGYSINELKVHLEEKFKKGMNWSNYGKGDGKWHIDHILPISKWNITSMECEDFRRCWALNNLQPLWEKTNLSKGNKITESKSQLEIFI